MLHVAHRGPLARLAAALVIASLSGAVRVAAAEPGEVAHRCQCPTINGRHECACPRCHEAAASARHEDLATMPPCHRAAAEKREKALRERAHHAAERDCASPLCSMPDGRLAPPPGLDAYTLPEPPRLVLASWGVPLVLGRAAVAWAPAAVDPPPPRAG
jgi:hypothetical protein